MIVDDSPVARAVLARMISTFPDFEIVATAGRADEALEKLTGLSVDIVLLDVEMPGTSGLNVLPEILRAGNGAKVLIVSSNAEDGAEAAVRALSLGAADTLPKPGTGNFGGRFAHVLADRLRRIGRVERDESESGGEENVTPIVRAAAVGNSAPYVLRKVEPYRIGCLGLGASTGGLKALSDFLRHLPDTIGAPILITQHLPPVFMPHFARQVEAASGRLTRVAEPGLPLKAEEILVAPGDAHLCLERRGGMVRVTLSTDPASSGCLPSVDPMLASIARMYGKRGAAVIFSGMGRDGLVGAGELAERGGVIFAQDEESSAVWGMPRVVTEAGLASAVAPPAQLAGHVAERAQEGVWK
ncbi:chemotaxis protein CheB [Allosphingosinicella vermicomposti]|uniref:chemotaxis protein CheB n=1 Tax=Allosphingosinicella vermicomposti TaxID=614671 RepID=UPI000D0EF97D|nr:chemotaxis protein CheB [Allosphingosinicella vermicomposti]